MTVALIFVYPNVDRDALLLKEKFIRCPSKMDAPEVVLSQAHGQARLVVDFLHENGKICMHILFLELVVYFPLSIERCWLIISAGILTYLALYYSSYHVNQLA